MAESHSVSSHTRASPWPVFVALGLVLSEMGVIFGSVAVSVAGILLFSGSVVGILRESEYADTLSVPTLSLGVIFGSAGLAVYTLTAFTFRGTYLGATGALLVVAAAVLYAVETERI